LKRVNVDVNPEYSDSLDNEAFSMHLMLEQVESPLVSVPGKKTDLPTMMSPLFTFPAKGKQAFEAGIDEVMR
jgi:hypothetical protein